MLIDGTKRKEESTMIGGQPSAMMTGTGTSNMGQTGTKGGTSSGGFTNLNKYIAKNNDPSKMVTNLAKTANDTTQQGQTAIAGAKDFGNQSLGQLQDIQGKQKFITSAFEKPEDFVSQGSNVNQFKTLRTSFNADPNKIVNQFNDQSAQADAQKNQAVQKLQSANTKGGLTEYLRTQRTKPSYTQGSQALDRFIVKESDPGKQTLANIESQANQLQSDRTLQDLNESLMQNVGKIDRNLLNADQISNFATGQRNQYQTGLGPLDRNRAQSSLVQRIFGGDQSAYSAAQNKARERDAAIQNKARLDNEFKMIDSPDMSGLENSMPEIFTNINGNVTFRNDRDSVDARNALESIVQSLPIQDAGDVEQQRGRRKEALKIYARNRAGNPDAQLEQLNANPLVQQYMQFQNNLNNATNQFAMTPQEEARYRALATLSGFNADDFLNARI